MLASFQEFTNRNVYGEFLTETVDETSISVFFLHWLLAFTKRKVDSSVGCDIFVN